MPTVRSMRRCRELSRPVRPVNAEYPGFQHFTVEDLDDMTAVLSAPDPVRVDRSPRTRADAERWIE